MAKKLTRADRIERLLALGLSKTEAKKNASREKYTKTRKKIVSKKRRERKKLIMLGTDTTRNKNNLVVMYRDKTQSTEDYGFLLQYIALDNKADVNSKIKFIQEALRNPTSIGELGEYRMCVTKNVSDYINIREREGFVCIFKGNGRSLPSLISLINLVMSLLYEPIEKYTFVSDLVDNLLNVDNAEAKKNGLKIKELFL